MCLTEDATASYISVKIYVFDETEGEDEMEKMIDGEMLNVPEHVAIILDGNGRWAKKRFMPRNYGHMQGAKTVERYV